MNIKYRNQLPDLMKEMNLPLIAIEAGVAEGRLSLQFLQSGIEKLYLIDYWGHLNQPGDGGYNELWHTNNYKEMIERTEPYKDKIVILKGLTTEMAKLIPDESVYLVYVDANHTYEGCYSDSVAFLPKLAKGGIMAYHDFLNLSYGVNKAVKDFCALHGYDIIVIPDEEPSMASCYFIK